MPLPVITVAQMREWEQATWAAGQTEKEVIRQVGRALARKALDLTRSGSRILILAGKGHNGDDARAVVGHLADRQAELIEILDPPASLSRVEAALLGKPDLVIDGLFGLGLNRGLSAEWVALLEEVNRARLRVLAVDVPSGLNAETGTPEGAAIRAEITATVGAPKLGLLGESAAPFVGRLEVLADVGLAPCPASSELQWTTAEDFRCFPPPRPVASHKGSYGHLAIVAGSLGFHGAAVLATRGAQRAQPGLVTLHTMGTVYPVIAPQLQAAMARPWQPEADFRGPWSAILVGPGLAGTDVPEQLKTQVRGLWRDSALSVIVDASALDWLPPDAGTRSGIRVITPHPGEAARLLRSDVRKVQADRVEAVRQISREFGNAWVVLKGHHTLIGRGTGEIYVNPTGNPHLAQGGSGDLLSGFLGGLLAQPALQEHVALTLRYAAWQHGAAADLLQARQPNWIIEDLAATIGCA